MSASHRKLSRLPLEIFADLVVAATPVEAGGGGGQTTAKSQPSSTAETLRLLICKKLKRFPSQRGGVQTIGELFRTSKRTLLLALDPLLTMDEIEQWLQRIYQHCSAKSTHALALLQATNPQLPTTRTAFGEHHHRLMRYLPTGLESLDRALQGGIRVGTVTELVGKAGVGKTQLAFQLCIWAAKYQQAALYLDTERKMVLSRLAEMSRHWHSCNGHDTFHDSHHNESAFSYNDTTSSSSPHDRNTPNDTTDPTTMNTITSDSAAFSFQSAEQVLANLTVEAPSSTEELLQTLDAVEERILSSSTTTTKLLIVDSIAAPLKRDFGSDSAPKRSAAIFKCAQRLKRLAETLQLAVVVLNHQVTSTTTNTNTPTYTDSNPSLASSMETESALSVRAALGTSWHHCVSTRLVLEHLQPPSSSRRISIVKSNIAPFATTTFEIDDRGIVEGTQTFESIQ